MGATDPAGKATLAVQQLYAAAAVHAAGPSALFIRYSRASRTNAPEPLRCVSTIVAAPSVVVPLA